MTGLEWALAVLAITVGATLQGSVGFGANMLAAPFILLLNDRLVPASLLITAMTLTGLLVLRERRSMNVRHVGDALVGRIPGTILGALAVAWLSRKGLSIVLGVSVLSACVIYWRGYSVHRTTATSVGAGFLSGFGATATAVGGPPMALLHSGDDGSALRGTLSGFFFIGTLFSIATLTLAGEFGWWELRWGASLLPGTVTGFLISSRLSDVIDEGHIRPLVLIASAIGGVLALVRAFVS